MTRELIKAAQSVIDNWETGDLAFAVRELDAALQNTLLTTSARLEVTRGKLFAEVLKEHFPWLGTDDDAGSGADVIGELGELYELLTADAPRQFWHMKLKGRDYYLIQNIDGSRYEFYRASKSRGWKLREPEIAIGAPVVDATEIAPVDLPQEVQTICLDYAILKAEEMR